MSTWKHQNAKNHTTGDPIRLNVFINNNINETVTLADVYDKLNNQAVYDESNNQGFWKNEYEKTKFLKLLREGKDATSTADNAKK